MLCSEVGRRDPSRGDAFSRLVNIAVLALAASSSRASAQKTPPRQEYVQTVDGQIAYTIQGKGRGAMMLAGGPGMSGSYLSQVADKLSEHAFVIAPDARGTGNSRLTSVDSASITVAKAIRDIEDIRIATKQEKLVLIGHSWGGALAMAYAKAYPARVAGLVLIGSAGPTQISADAIGTALNARLTEADRDSIRMWSQLLQSPQRDRAQNELGRLNRKAYMYDAAKQPAVEAQRVNSYSIVVNRLMFADVERTHFDARPSADAARMLGTIPVIIAYGSADAIGNITAPYIKAAFPHAIIHVIAHSGHYPWVEAPVEFYRLFMGIL